MEQNSHQFTEYPETRTVDFIVGDNLANLCSDAMELGRRDAYYQAESFVNKNNNLRTVGIVYGMRSTGKTVILRQLAGRPDYLKISAYVSISYGIYVVEDIYKQIKSLYEQGIRYFYIDEVTWADGFIDRAMEFADIWAAYKGVRIVLSGTDSLSFTFAMQEALYGRYALFHTTPMSYSEYARIKSGDILSYAHSGGVFWDNRDVNTYLETSVVRNIYNSIQGIERQVILSETLRNVGQSEIYAICHGICMSVTQDFIYEHIKRAWDNPLLTVLDNTLSKSSIKISPAKKRLLATSPLFEVETTLFDVKYVSAILEVMRRIGFLVDMPVITDTGKTVKPIFSQTGVAREFTLEVIRMISADGNISPIQIERLEEVSDGPLLELSCFLAFLKQSSIRNDNSLSVFTFRDTVGDVEYDLVVYDKHTKSISFYEIKRSTTAKNDFCNHLTNHDAINAITGLHDVETVEKAVLYRGFDSQRCVHDEIIPFFEIGSFLKRVESKVPDENK